MKNKAKVNDETIYRITSGFVPGLPAECSLKQARELGLEADLLGAIDSGVYVSVETTPAPRGDKE